MFGPNITGQAHDIYGGPAMKGTGAFTIAPYNRKGSNGVEDKTYTVIGFDASDSSALYSGASMQPKALRALPCIRF